MTATTHATRDIRPGRPRVWLALAIGLSACLSPADTGESPCALALANMTGGSIAREAA